MEGMQKYLFNMLTVQRQNSEEKVNQIFQSVKLSFSNSGNFAATLMSLPIALLNFTTSTNAFTTWIEEYLTITNR